jgi:putative ABC transport system substrate-binding protein
VNRRAFITLLGSAAAWPLAARAQQPALPVVGVLSNRSPSDFVMGEITAFRQGLAEAGYVEGRNVGIEYRWADGKNDRLPELATDLVGRQVAVIAALGGTPQAIAARDATSTIPILFIIGGDPIKFNLVTSLNRPGGNITGVTFLTSTLSAKRLEVLREAAPNAALVGFLINPTNLIAESDTREVQEAARTLGLQLHVVTASTDRELDVAFATLSQLQVKALLVGNDSFFTGRPGPITALAARHAIPTIFSQRAFAVAGGLMSYGASITDAYRQIGVYTGRILKGEKPGDLPVQQSTRVELVLNLKTAKVLGLTFPLSLLGRADEVIE